MKKRSRVISLIAALAFVFTANIALFWPTAHANSSFYEMNGPFVWYSARIDDNTSELFTANQNGTGVRKITNDDTHDGNPQWYPDASRIIYDSQDSDTPNTVMHSIYIRNADGSNEVKLVDRNNSIFTSTLGEDDDSQPKLYDPSFSPDGTKIAFHFTGNRGTGNMATSKIFTADYNYSTNSISNITPLLGGNYLSNDLDDQEPVWSSDGTLLVFSRRTADTPSRYIHVANASTGAQVWQSANAEWDNTPQFGPHSDKNLIVAQKVSGGTGRLFVIDITNLSDVQQKDFGIEAPQPTWSPNGKKIAWGGAGGVVHILDYETSGQVQFKIQGYSSYVNEVDWARGTELPDVHVECETEVGSPCTVDIPEYCVDALLENPLRGSSAVANGKVTYTPNGNDADEENYVHLREDMLGNTARCYVKIRFIPKTPDSGKDEKNRLVLYLLAGGAVVTGSLVVRRKFAGVRRR